MKKGILVKGILLMVILLVTFSLAFAMEMEEKKETKPTPEQLFKTVCSQCHPVSRPQAKTKSATAWELTVKRMQKKDPSKISDDDAKVIIEFLTKPAEK